MDELLIDLNIDQKHRSTYVTHVALSQWTDNYTY